MPKLNIINIGKTGVGKSTIINAVFGKKEMAKTGIGTPVTQYSKPYSIPDSPITIYDTKGLETGGLATKQTQEDFYGLIRKQNSSPDTDNYIHIC